jgi:hypothetical protein
MVVTELERARGRALKEKADLEWLVRCYRLGAHLSAVDVAILCSLRGEVLRRLDSVLPPMDERLAVMAELEAVLALAERIVAEASVHQGAHNPRRQAT